MLKILIVDDEALVRAGIRVLLDWETYGFEIIGEAADGEDAWRAILSLKPDIIFTDIRMPKMDGIELLKKIKEHELPTVSIILSCFDDFELVREAMKLGAFDYIRKLSITPDSVLNVLNELRAKIPSVQTAAASPSGIKTEDLKYLFVKKLINNNYQDSFQVANMIQNLGLSICLDQYDLILFCMYIKNKAVAIDSENSRQSFDMIYYLCGQTCQVFHGCELISFDYGRFLIINSGKTDSKNVCSKLKEVLKNYTSVQFYFGISTSADGYTDFSNTLAKATAAMETAQFYQKEIILFSELTEKNPDFLYIEKEEQQLLDALILSNTAQSLELIYHILNRLKEHYYSQENCRNFCKGILRIFTRAAKELSVSLPLNDLSEQSDTLEQLIAAMISYTKFFISNIQESQTYRYHAEISMIKDYIQKHYHENIDLNAAAKMVNISPSHLSALFKKETGKNFSNYLIEVRMQTARRLLANSDICIYEIAEQTGYSNASYFGKAFKKQFGISPEEFRKNRKM